MNPNPVWIVLSVAGFVLSQTGAALCFKAASGAEGMRWWLFFAAGNAVGFGCTFTLAAALRGTSPNLIYAACYGGGFCLIQLASWWLFREPLSPWQWSGVACVGAGILLLQVR